MDQEKVVAKVPPMKSDFTEDLNLATHGEIAVMDKTGDTKIIWSRSNPDEVESARKQFDYFKSKKFAAFAVVGKDGSQGAQIDKFDPDAERIIFVPPMVGG